jgi:hypothetical protein
MSRFKVFRSAIRLLVIGTLLSSLAQAATIVTANSSTITSIDSYTSYGSGDVIFELANNSMASSCPYGFWICLGGYQHDLEWLKFGSMPCVGCACCVRDT